VDRPNYDPNYALYNMRVRGRIKDGVVTTDVMPVWTYNPGQGPAGDLFEVRFRFAPQPDGSMKGLIGGYKDIRGRGFGGYGEGLFNFQAPAVYYSMRRNADGLYDPASGEYHGLSMAYEVDTVPAFLTPGCWRQESEPLTTGIAHRRLGLVITAGPSPNRSREDKRKSKCSEASGSS
jgi:hypothetical protein